MLPELFHMAMTRTWLNTCAQRFLRHAEGRKLGPLHAVGSIANHRVAARSSLFQLAFQEEVTSRRSINSSHFQQRTVNCQSLLHRQNHSRLCSPNLDHLVVSSCHCTKNS